MESWNNEHFCIMDKNNYLIAVFQTDLIELTSEVELAITEQ